MSNKDIFKMNDPFKKDENPYVPEYDVEEVLDTAIEVTECIVEAVSDILDFFFW
ncbi:MAG: hypothetical protein Q4C49_13725 [Bacillota bacterium]|nr:hypothetical protein [Bacillota bacterium]